MRIPKVSNARWKQLAETRVHAMQSRAGVARGGVMRAPPMLTPEAWEALAVPYFEDVIRRVNE